MSNIYIQEPPTYGKILLETTVGDIDVELWSKETPKACRNFVQLCADGYYANTIFHRLVKDFIVQGGDPTGTGNGGDSIYGGPFKDEFHSRLKFNRRGLLAMANAGKDDNGSQFFFTLAACPELQNKHTIFGKVTGNTVYNMLKLADGLVDNDERPVYPHKILGTKNLKNPFPDIVPRKIESKKSDDEQNANNKKSAAATKNYKLLSFGDEAEDDEEETVELTKKIQSKPKSSHDLLTNDPKLSSQPAVEEGDVSSDSDVDSEEVTKESLDAIKSKLKRKPIEEEKIKEEEKKEEEEEDYLFKDKHREEQKRIEAVRDEIRNLKKGMKKVEKKESAVPVDSKGKVKSDPDNELLSQYHEEQDKYDRIKQVQPKKGDKSREEQTLALLAKFQSKLKQANRGEEQDEEGGSSSAKEEPKEEEDWLSHKLHFESDEPVIAKDANLKADDWYEITDPRSAVAKRRREKGTEGSKGKKEEGRRDEGRGERKESSKRARR